MSRDQRVRDNHALLSAQKHALAKKLPLAVIFCLYEKSGVRAKEHYRFMLDGLEKLENDLKQLNIPFMMLIGEPKERLGATFHHLRPTAVYFDFNPLKGPIMLQNTLSKHSDYAMYVVDSHNLVPVWVTSDKREVGAYTIRPKIHKKLAEYLVEPDKLIKHPINWPGEVKKLAELKDIIDSVLDKIKPSGISINFKSGELAARQHLDIFIDTKLATYAIDRNDPTKGSQSDLSPYLHFGQISSLRVALLLQEEAYKNNSELHFLSSPKMPKPEFAENTMQHGIDSLIEEMIVRKELADNFCYYDENYDNLDAAPSWARISINKHRDDPREHVYSLEVLEHAKTHDPAWNAAQRQLTTTGKMHGYMRMYWAKKVLEWSPSRADVSGVLDSFLSQDDIDGTRSTATHTSRTKETANNTQLISPLSQQSIISNLDSLDGPEWAIGVLKYLNDHYSIDGGDPNGYAGIMWSVGGVHDRPWVEREIFGVIRYMNYAGLKRKFDTLLFEDLYMM
jgi:deoxyribodipyrimidine photo-lyase